MSWFSPYKLKGLRMKVTIHHDKRGLAFLHCFGVRSMLPDESEDWTGVNAVEYVKHPGVDWELECWQRTGKAGAIGNGDWSGLGPAVRDALRERAKELAETTQGVLS